MRMVVAAGLGALLASCAMGSDAGPASVPRDARVPLIGADGSRHGTVQLIQVHGSVMVQVQAENLPPGVHGAHIHSVGRCDRPDFSSAGPHWNPTGRQHGRQNPAGPHLGDTPNINVGANGRAYADLEIPKVWVRANEPRILDADGAAFVIHASPDDHRTDPSGNSGARIACAVLR